MTNTDELIELVAKAVWREYSRTDAHLPFFGRAAKASLEAIDQAGLVIVPREPTEGMDFVGRNQARDCSENDCHNEGRHVWKAMIQAAESSRS